jgi:hypothetical protein
MHMQTKNQQMHQTKWLVCIIIDEKWFFFIHVENRNNFIMQLKNLKNNIKCAKVHSKIYLFIYLFHANVLNVVVINLRF